MKLNISIISVFYCFKMLGVRYQNHLQVPRDLIPQQQKLRVSVYPRDTTFLKQKFTCDEKVNLLHAC